MVGASFLRGVPDEELARFLDSLERRTYAAGVVVVGEGDRLGEIYLAQAGRAEVVVAGANGSERRVGNVEPGETVGEMALLTGEAAAATVRALSDFEVLVVTRAEFASLSGRFPVVYRELGAIRAERLARTNRLVARAEAGHLGALIDERSPPLLGYALACSVAWHTGERTLLVSLGEEHDDELTRHATIAPGSGASGAGSAPRAELLVSPPTGPFAPNAIGGTVDSLLESFRHVLIQGTAEQLAALSPRAAFRLGSVEAAPREDSLLVRAWAQTPVTTRPDADRVVDVPPLAEADLESLRNGLLPSSTAAGRALGWAARDLTGLKVGLALGAGSLRGWAHVGVIAALQRAGLQFDYVAGTSVGAAVTGLLALGNSPERIADILGEFSPNLVRLTVPSRSLLSNRGMRRYMQTVAPEVRIEDLELPIAIVTADILSRREVIFRRGSLWQAVLTSISIPGIYPASPMGPRMLVDGGILNPVPANVAATMGAGVVVGVRLTAPRPESEELECVPAAGRPPSALSVLLRSVEIMQGQIAGEPADANVVTIEPRSETQGAKLTRFADGRQFIRDGEEAAERALPRVAAALPWLRSVMD